MSELQDFDAMIDDPFKDDVVNEYAAQIDNPFEVEDLSMSDEENDFGDLKVDFIKALILNDDIIGYRIRTNKGLFDLSLKAAREHGLYNYRVTKGIPVRKYEDYGKYMSESEYANKMIVPDISDNDELCNQIITILLTEDWYLW